MAGKLTDTAIKNAKAGEKTRELSDGDGLTLEIAALSKGGSKKWRFRYMLNGKRTRLGLGHYPEVSLLEARKKALELRKMIGAGIDPSQAKKEAKVEAVEEEKRKASTFEVVACEFFDKRTIDLEAKHRKVIRSRLQRLIDAFGEKQIGEVERQDILQCLRPYEACGNNETAHRLAELASRVYRYARDAGYVEFNIAEGLTGALSRVTHTKRAALTNPKQIGELLRAIDEYRGDVSTRYALRILPYVFVRSSELRGTRWSELDLDEGYWVIPAARMKKRNEHLVPLARQVVTLFEELQEYTGDGELCFPSPMSRTRQISDVGLLNALRRLGYGKEEMCVHGFRSIASTCLNEQGFRPDIIEAQLAHVEKNNVRAAYNRAQYLEERREMMQRYADYLDSLRNCEP